MLYLFCEATGSQEFPEAAVGLVDESFFALLLHLLCADVEGDNVVGHVDPLLQILVLDSWLAAGVLFLPRFFVLSLLHQNCFHVCGFDGFCAFAPVERFKALAYRQIRILAST